VGSEMCIRDRVVGNDKFLESLRGRLAKQRTLAAASGNGFMDRL